MSISTTNIDFIVVIDASAYTTETISSIGLTDGVFQWATSSSESTPNIISEIGSISRSIDISETGGFSPNGSFDCTVQNSESIDVNIKTLGINMVGCPLAVSIASTGGIDLVYTGLVSAWSMSESEINISASVEGMIPSGDIQTAIIDETTYPSAGESDIGKPVPIVCGDVLYSPAVNTSSNGTVILERQYVSIASASPDGEYFELNISDTTSETVYRISISQNPCIVFTNGPEIPDRTFPVIKTGGTTGAWTIMISCTEDLGIHKRDESTPLNGNRLWWYKIIDVNSEAVFSLVPNIAGYGQFNEQDSLSYYNDSTGNFVRSIGLCKSIDNGKIVKKDILSKENTISVYNINRINGIGFDVTATSTAYEINYVSGDLDDIINGDGLNSPLVYNIVDPAFFADEIKFSYTGITKDNLTLNAENILATDFGISYDSAYHKSYIKTLAYIATLQDDSTVIIYSDTFSAIPYISFKDILPPPFYTTTKETSIIDNVINAGALDNYSLLKIPQDIVKSLHDGIYKSIDILIIHERTPSTGYTTNINIYGVGLVVGVASLEKDSIVYISTEGETLHNNGSAKCDSVVYGLRHLIEDYVSLPSQIGTNGSAQWHIGRTLTEAVSLQEIVDNLCRQSFLSLFFTASGVIGGRDWIYDSESSATTEYDFTPQNIIRDSISSWQTTPSSKIYNSFTCAYDYNYATSSYDKKMSILKPNATLPAITEAWDAVVSGIGTGSDATAYAEALEAHGLVESGYNQTRQLRAYPTSGSELSWFVDPSWVTGGTIAKTDLSAWKYLKRCAYWLSTPRREVKFRVPLTYASVELLNYCSFADPVYTQGNILKGWITSISIDLDGIDLTMSMDRDSEGLVYLETGSADTEIVETGSQTTDIRES